MRAGVLAPISLCGLAALLAWSSPAPGTAQATRTIDRTVLCSTLTGASGTGKLALVSEPRKWFRSPRIAVWARAAGSGVEPLVEVFGGGRFGSYVGDGGLYVGKAFCRSVPHSFTVSRSGLAGTSSDRAGVETCWVGRSVLIRARVELVPKEPNSDPPPIGVPEPPALAARGEPVVASIAVRTHPARVPVAYLLLHRGRTTVVTAARPRCGTG